MEFRIFKNLFLLVLLTSCINHMPKYRAGQCLIETVSEAVVHVQAVNNSHYRLVVCEGFAGCIEDTVRISEYDADPAIVKCKNYQKDKISEFKLKPLLFQRFMHIFKK